MQSISRRACLLRVQTADAARQLILLTHGDRDRARNPHIARHEYQLLRALRRQGLPVAQPLHLDETHMPPFFITDCLPGAAPTSADIQPLAETLRDIHALDWRGLKLDFLPRASLRLRQDLADRQPENSAIADALREYLPHLRENPPALLHGDFWLGNLLWEADEISGVIDWEDAMLGDALADLGKCRLELLWSMGAAAMASFTAAYLALRPNLDGRDLPFWDLWGALRLGHYPDFAPESASVPVMRAQYDDFVSAALRRL